MEPSSRWFYCRNPRLGPGRPPLTKILADRRIVVAGVVVAVAIVWWLTSSGGTVHYTAAAVTRGAVTRTVTATGTVNPVLTIIVGSYVSGVIQDLQCDYNTQVKQGQICAKIDPRPYQSVVDQNKANLDMAKAQLEKDKASARLRTAQLRPQRAAGGNQRGFQGHA